MRVHVVALCLLLAACASDPGWHGERARPFDVAQAECRARVASSPVPEREQAFEQCMGEQGWSRPEGSARGRDDGGRK
jgi:hypothetical protein